MIMKKYSFFISLTAFAAFFETNSVVSAQASNNETITTSAVDEIFTVVTSSFFKMTLYPTQDPLDATASNKVQHAIKTVLLLSTSVTTNFVAVEDIIISLQKIEYQKSFEPLYPLSNFSTTPASTLKFEVQTTFLVDQKPLPSKFALDNLIVRTFSQPSSKSSFIVTLGLARDPILNEVLDIEIDIVDESRDAPTVDNGTSLSYIDIVLIVASAIIFFGIIAVICYYHYARSGAEQERPTNSSRETKKALEAGESSDIHIDTSDSKESKTNGTPDSSPKGTDLVSAKEVNNHEDSEMIHFEENIVEGSSLESSVDEHSASVIPAAESPDVSYASSSASTTRHSNSVGSSSASAASSDSDSSSSSSSSSSASSSDADDEASNSDIESKAHGASVSSQLLGAEKPNYCESSVSGSQASDLAARLTSLSTISAFDLSARFNLYSSSSSAPPILEDIREEESSADERTFGEKTVYSARSASSESFDSGRQAHVYPRGKRGCWIGSPFRESSAQFHENWIESKRKAMEDIEEGSVEDVFRIDVYRAGAMDEDHSKASARSTSVSEWMKNIRVVGSASETQSSVEHSSVEPRSQAKDSSSVDFSLEQSLAASLVEV